MPEYLISQEVLAWRLNAARERASKAEAALATFKAQLAIDQATLARVRDLSADMRTWCSPHGIASDYADRLDAALADVQPDATGSQPTSN